MSRKLTLELTDEAYESLIEEGQDRGESPEDLASRVLTARFTDPLLRLSGCIKSSIKDVAERHDEFLAKGILEKFDE